MSAKDIAATLARARGYELDLEVSETEDRVALSGAVDLALAIPRPASSQNDRLHDLHHALPGRARGDQRELLLASIVRDAAGTRPDATYDELRTLLDKPGAIPAGNDIDRNVLASVLREHYWVHPEATGNRVPRPFAFPYHAALPANYSEGGSAKSGSYYMFRSDILLFFCWDGTGIDEGPVRELCSLLSARDELTLLDETLLDAALGGAGPSAITGISADSLLASGQAEKVRDYLAGGAFHQPAHDRFRRDLVAALRMPLPRHDLVEAAILTLSLHLALYYYAISFKLGQGLETITAVAAGRQLEPDVSFDGRMLFRIGTSEARPVRRTDGCAASWRELDDRYLVSLVPNIITANTLHLIWQAAIGDAPALANPRSLAEAIAADRQLGASIDLAASAVALAYAERAGAATPELERVASISPGMFALREQIMATQRGTLQHRSRKVVNQLIKRSFGGSLIRTQGPVIFFELDEAFLFLLVRFVLGASGQQEMPFRQFLRGLEAYGLKPQDASEEARLADILERLGMLYRYSDAGEAVYVRHLL